MDLNISIKFDEEKNSWMVIPKGEVDIYTSPKFKKALTEAFEEKETNIIIDGKELEYVDSTGLGVLISILKRVKEKNYEITIINIKSNIKKLFDITGLDKVFVIKE